MVNRGKLKSSKKRLSQVHILKGEPGTTYKNWGLLYPAERILREWGKGRRGLGGVRNIRGSRNKRSLPIKGETGCSEKKKDGKERGGKISAEVLISS